MKLKIRWYQITLDYDCRRWHVDAPAPEWEFMLNQATKREKLKTIYPLDAKTLADRDVSPTSDVPISRNPNRVPHFPGMRHGCSINN